MKDDCIAFRRNTAGTHGFASLRPALPWLVRCGGGDGDILAVVLLSIAPERDRGPEMEELPNKETTRLHREQVHGY